MNNVLKFIGAITAFTATLLMAIRKASAESTVTELLDDSGLFTSLNNIVFTVIAIGGFWIVGMLVWGGMTLAGSGGNPQKRTEGLLKLSLVIVGAYVIYKSHDIAGYVAAIAG